MALIEWDDSLKLGIAVVDRQHERLVGIVNRLHEATVQGSGTDVIGEIMDELIIYTATHFSVEEKYFAQFDYPDAEEHKREHEALKENAALVKLIDVDDPGISRDIDTPDDLRRVP